MIKHIHIIFFLIAGLYIFNSQINAQVTIGSGSVPENFSILQIEGVTGGIRLPQLTTAQRNNLNVANNSEANGLVIFNTTTGKLEYWDGSRWVALPITLAENGLSLASNGGIKLGGTLIENTHLSGGEQNLYFDLSTGSFIINQSALVFKNTGIGVGTSSPIGTLHVDAKNDNAPTPTTNQLKDDIIIDSSGKLGVGMIPSTSDESRLQVNGTVAIKNSGTISSGNTYLLTTSDGSGQTRWKKNVSLTSLVIGSSTGGYSGRLNSYGSVGYTIALPPGGWVIQTAFLFVYNTVGSGRYVWGSVYWADTNSSQTPSSDIQKGRFISGMITSNKNYTTAFGLTYIINSSSASKTYYLRVKPADTNITGTPSWNNIGSSTSWTENSVIAFPVTNTIID